MNHKNRVNNMVKFDALIRHYANETGLIGARFSLVGLYDEAVLLAEKLENNGEITFGKDTICVIPMENGDFVRFTFDKKFTRAEKIDPSTGLVTDLVTPTINETADKTVMYNYVSTLKEKNLGIGPRFDDEFKSVLSNSKVGDVLVADNGRSFAVIDRNGKEISLLQMSGLGIVPTIENFSKQHKNTFSIEDNDAVQGFYRAIRDKYDYSASGRITRIEAIEELYNKIKRRISDYAGEISLGPNRFKVINGENGLIWFDSKGNKYDENVIKPLLAWLSNAPVDVSYNNPDKSESALVIDLNERSELLGAFSSGNILAGLARAEEYCRKGDKTISFTMKTYVPGENNTYKGIGISCGIEDNKFKITLIEYKDNDISQDPVKFTLISKSDFIQLCSSKYSKENLIYIENKNRKDILQMYADKVSDERRESVEKMWELINIRMIDSTIKKRELSKFGAVFSDIDIMDDTKKNKGIKNLAAEYRKNGYEPGD